MTRTHNQTLVSFILVTLTLAFISGCVYYNTFYHARRWFNEAEQQREAKKSDVATGAEINLYRDAIIKSSKVLQEHPTSSWVDDALFIIGKSFYHLEENARAERKFRELLSSFPESEYATESQFYLGKARYRLENYALARETFTSFMREGSKKKWRGEATYLMGEIAAAEGDTARAVDYYRQYLDEFSGGPHEQEVEFKVGQFEYVLQDYAESAEAFGEAAESADDPAKRYNALYEQGRAYYRMDSVEAGLEVYRRLKEEQQDSVKLGEILLRIAEGLKLKGEEREAILLYDRVGTEFHQRAEAAEAWYQIGAIAQSWGDLDIAKEYFDKASRVGRGSDFKTRAIERAAEITKVETFRANLKSESVEEASRSRFLLAELYRTALDNPDSALAEYQGLVRTFPESGYAPKALLNIGYLYETHLEDTTTASEYYEQVLRDYPRSDEVGSALKLLGDNGAEPDVLYPDKLYRMAEEQHYEEENLDSALALYRLFVEEFPESELKPMAEFAAAKVQLAQFVPSDDPPTENPYREADSLLAVEAAREDSIARVTADSLATARKDSIEQTRGERVTAVTKEDSVVTMVFSGDSTMVDTASAFSGDVRLTDFIGSKEVDEFEKKDDKPPARARGGDSTGQSDLSGQMSRPDSLPADTTSGEAVPELSDSSVVLADSLKKPAVDTVATDLPQSGTAPADKKRISLENFPTAQPDTVSDTLTATADSLVAGIVEGDSLGVGVGVDSLDMTTLDSTAVDSTEVVVVDSSMIWLFQHLANKYEGTDIGKEAARLARGETVRKPQRNIQQPRQRQVPVAQEDTAQAETDSIPEDPFAFQDTLGAASAIEEALREEIDKWPLMQDEPVTIPEFDYPAEAATSKFEGRVTTKIKIDYDGRVTEVEILKGTNVPLLDLAIENTLLETYFDPMKIEPLHLGSYFIYYYEVVLPEVYR